MAALESVEKTSAPTARLRKICSFLEDFLRVASANSGQKATKKNPKLIGLSKRN